MLASFVTLINGALIYFFGDTVA